MQSDEMHNEARRQRAFDFLVACALEGRACPKWHEPPMYFGVFNELAGRGLVHISEQKGEGGAFRRVTILVGEHAGAKTATRRNGKAPKRPLCLVRHTKCQDAGRAS